MKNNNSAAKWLLEQIKECDNKILNSFDAFDIWYAEIQKQIALDLIEKYNLI